MKLLKNNSLSLNQLDGNTARLLTMLVAIFLVASFTKPDMFLTGGNFQSMSKQLVEYGLLSLGVGIAMISGGIDLSVVYIANLSAIVAGMVMNTLVITATGPEQLLIILIAILAGVLTGLICGAFNGFLISKLHIPAMLATLGTMQLFMGIAIIISGGSTVSGIPKMFSQLLSNSYLFGIPLTFFIYLIVVGAIIFIMSKTKFGMRVFMIGTNARAAAFSGIKINNVLIKTYMLSGVLASFAGILSLARLSSAKADFGSSYIMQTILIVVLGGINPNGGYGTIRGILLATIIVQLISSFLNMFPEISNYYRDLIWGVAVIAVLIVNFNANKKTTAKLAKATAN